jgi:hypothetical protein
MYLYLCTAVVCFMFDLLGYLARVRSWFIDSYICILLYWGDVNGTSFRGRLNDSLIDRLVDWLYSIGISTLFLDVLSLCTCRTVIHSTMRSPLQTRETYSSLSRKSPSTHDLRHPITTRSASKLNAQERSRPKSSIIYVSIQSNNEK